MRLLVIGEDIKLKDSEFDKIIQTVFYPMIDGIKEIAILNATGPEIQTVKWAKQFKIPYIGFLYSQETAIDYADCVVYIGKNSEDSNLLQACDEKRKRKIIYKIAA